MADYRYNNYKLQDFFAMISDYMHGGASALSFMPPRNVAEIDTLAYNQSHQLSELQRVLTPFITQTARERRNAGLSSFAGASSAISIVDGISQGFGDLLRGHFGAQEAASTFINNAASIASSRGAATGGLLSPVDGIKAAAFAARQGAMAYTNNFNRDGTINTGQTFGLNLAESAYISSRALSDRSQYKAWADRMLERGPGLTESERSMTDQEITNFRDGIGDTKKAGASFNEQIKKFTKEVNSMVASMAKITGDTGTAIEELQRATQGKLFSAGADAERLRRNAARMTAMLRVSGVDSGLIGVGPDGKPYNVMSEYAGDTFGRLSSIRGVNPLLDTSTQMGNLSNVAALGFSTWLSRNKGATQFEKDRMNEAFKNSVEQYATGDVANMTPLLARLVDTGVATKEEAMGVMKSGDADKIFNFLSDKYGGRGAVLARMRDKRELERYRHAYAATTDELDQVGATIGANREMGRLGTTNLFNNLVSDYAADRMNEQKAEQDRLLKEKRGSREDFLLDALAAANPEKAAQVKRLRQEANDAGLSYEQIKDAAGDYGLSVKDVDKKVDERVEAVTGVKVQSLEDIKKGVNDRYRESLLDNEVLGAAGLSIDQTKYLRERAKRNNWSAETILKEIGKFKDADSEVAKRAAMQRAASGGGKTGADSRLKAATDKMLGGTKEEREHRAAVEVLAKKYGDKIDEAKAIANDRSLPLAERQKALARLRKTAEEEDIGLTLESNSLAETMIGNAVDGSLSPEEQSKRSEAMVKRTGELVKEGKSMMEALSIANDELKFADPSKFDAKARDAAIKQLYSDETLGLIATDFVNQMFEDNLSDEDKVGIVSEYKKYRKDPRFAKMSDETVMVQALRDKYKERLKDEGREEAANKYQSAVAARLGGFAEEAMMNVDAKMVGIDRGWLHKEAKYGTLLLDKEELKLYNEFLLRNSDEDVHGAAVGSKGSVEAVQMGRALAGTVEASEEGVRQLHGPRGDYAQRKVANENADQAKRDNRLLFQTANNTWFKGSWEGMSDEDFRVFAKTHLPNMKKKGWLSAIGFGDDRTYSDIVNDVITGSDEISRQMKKLAGDGEQASINQFKDSLADVERIAKLNGGDYEAATNEVLERFGADADRTKPFKKAIEEQAENTGLSKYELLKIYNDDSVLNAKTDDERRKAVKSGLNLRLSEKNGVPIDAEAMKQILLKGGGAGTPTNVGVKTGAGGTGGVGDGVRLDKETISALGDSLAAALLRNGAVPVRTVAGSNISGDR